MEISMKNKIFIFDTTLRDGAQTPGIGLGFQSRYYIAKALTNVGVDAIEIGFAANENDFAFMKDIAKYIGSRKYSSNNNIPVMVSLLVINALCCAAEDRAESGRRRTAHGPHWPALRQHTRWLPW